VTFIDEFSKKTWIFFMKTKDEVFGQFQKFRAQMENHTRNNIKFLRSNSGGEYTSNEFKDFRKEAGIKRESIVSYNPQLNGVVERNNRSIIHFSSAMIHDRELHVFIWVEVCNTIVYVQNKNPHKILRDKTPKEDFSGVNPDIGNLSIFGFLVYIHFLVEKRKNLEPSG
jgi:transposase InsO family protein